MGKIWIISDTHFNHKNIIDYCKRPFKDINEMNEYLINKWNELVSDEDTVYHLGDFAMGNSEDIKRIVDKLNGNIILITGNHDKKGISAFKNYGFKEVYKNECYINFNGVELWLSHRPHNETKKFNIHGHVHNDFSHEVTNPKCFCVCVEQINYQPILLEDVVNRIKK